MENTQLLLDIQRQLNDLKKGVDTLTISRPVSNKWVTRKEVMDFFQYKPTQMAAFEKDDSLIVAKVGKRKFILRESLEKILNRNIIK